MYHVKSQQKTSYDNSVLLNKVLSSVTNSLATSRPFPLCKCTSWKQELAVLLPESIIRPCGGDWRALHTWDAGLRLREHTSFVSEILISPGLSAEYKKQL